MFTSYSLELARAGRIVAESLCSIKAGESVLITLDTQSDYAPVEAIARSAESLGANVLVAWHSTPNGYGSAAESRMPEPLKHAIRNTDVWIECNSQWLLYSQPWIDAISNGRTRYLVLGNLTKEQITRCIANIDIPAQRAFQNKFSEIIQNTKHCEIKTRSGTEINFEIDPFRPVLNETCEASKPGAFFLIGQIGWAPIESTINGKIVFDGSFSGGGIADLGILKSPIELEIIKGRIVNIVGNEEAKFVENWLKSFNDPSMYQLAHISLGFNPGAKLTGVCVEDERVWGTSEWGIGFQGPMFKGDFGFAPTHADGTCLNSSIKFDGNLVTEDGQIVHPELKRLASIFGK